MSKKQAQSILKDEKKLNDLAKLAFDGSDTDHSAFIEIGEMKAIITSRCAEIGMNPPKDKDIQNMISHLDTNNNNKLEFEEFKMFIIDVLKSAS